MVQDLQVRNDSGSWVAWLEEEVPSGFGSMEGGFLWLFLMLSIVVRLLLLWYCESSR